MIAGLIVPTLIKEVMKSWQDGRDAKKWRDARQAKFDQESKEYLESLKKAGDDEQAQKDAADKFFGPK